MSINFAGTAILLDVEGTTSAVAYVYDVMFPFARKRLESFVAEHWMDSSLEAVRSQFGASFRTAKSLSDEAARLMDGDAKATGLKTLQGLIWESGFHNGELQAHVFEDVPSALAAWRKAGADLRVYSSGSIHAQRLFFGHSEAGDLLPYFTGHYDTTTGPKRETASYAVIAQDWGVPAGEILFLSDVTEELNAAREAGMQTVLVKRLGNAEPTPADPPHGAISSFAEIELTLVS